MPRINTFEPAAIARELAENSSRTKLPAFEGFFDFASQKEAASSLSKFPVYFELYGGYPYAERKLIGVHSEMPPHGAHPDVIAKNGTLSPGFDFPVSAIEVRGVTSDRRITPKQVRLTLSQLGLPERALGDVIAIEGRSVVFALAIFADEIKSGLSVIGGAPAVAKVSAATGFANYEPPEENAVIASGRLDAALSGIFRISREDSSQAVKNGMALVNYETAAKPSFEVRPGDFVSLETRGRARIISAEKTAKDRLRVVFTRY